MNLEERIAALTVLGDNLKVPDEEMKAVIEKAAAANVWFTIENITAAVENVIENFLQKDKLQAWTKNITFKEVKKNIGIVAAGNIPLVAFHDVIAGFMAGHTCKIKLSQKDEVLLPAIINKLNSIDPRCAAYFEIVDFLKDIDAVIATGSDNSSRYFHYYFDKYPHIIRKNRVGLAVIWGNETDDELLAIGEDVFQYYGLGCRNVSSLRIPDDFDLSRILKLWDHFQWVRDNHAYNNNFEYNLAIYIMNQVPYWANDTLIMIEDNSLVSRLGVVHFTRYNDLDSLAEEIKSNEDKLQVIISNRDFNEIRTTRPGLSQCPGLADYADGINTLEFLSLL